MYKKCKLVMLPTKEKANVYLNQYADAHNKADKLVFGGSIKEELTSTIEQLKDRGYEAQRLYLLSDDEIKPEDWVVAIYDGTEKPYIVIKCGSKASGNYKKIIASTNTKLTVKAEQAGENAWYNPMPLIPQSFIEYYVEQYNLGNIITEVLVEYEYRHDDSVPYPKTLDGVATLKVNADNTINIKPIKESWSREEVVSLIKGFDNCIRTVRDAEIEYRNKWIEENL